MRRACTCIAILILAAACGREDSSAPIRVESARFEALDILGRAPWFMLTDSHGEDFDSRRLWGRPYVIEFFTLQEREAEPERSKRLMRLRAAGPSDAWCLVGITLDPERDTPDALSAYAVRSSGGAAHDALLTGPREDGLALRDHGFGARVGADLMLVDGRGRLRGRFDGGDDTGIQKLAAALAGVLGEVVPERIATEDQVFDPPWLGARADAQLAAARGWSVRHEFRFQDKRLRSGIRFVHRCVDDAGLHYKMNHYDHGSGVAVADVNGDGLLDLFFTNQVGSNQLWMNLGGGRFEDFSERAGVALSWHTGVSASFADTDNDGDPDLFITTVNSSNQFFVNDGTGRFTNMTEAAGLHHNAHSSAGVFFDYDRDGRLDLFLCNVGKYTHHHRAPVTNDGTTAGQEPGDFTYRVGYTDAFSGHLKPSRAERSILYRNVGGNRFEDVSERMGLVDESWTGAASPVDLNEDGWMDLYVLNMQGHDEYYENQGGRRFVRRSRELFPRTPWGSMGIKVFDFDQDQHLDIFVTDMHSDMSVTVDPEDEKKKAGMRWPESLLRSGGQSIFGNAFYRCTGKDRFVECSDEVGAENFWPWGLSIGDLNADGYEDAFLTSSMNYQFRYGVNSVLLNDGGRRFVDSEFVLGVEPRKGPLAKPWFDLDCSDPKAKNPLCQGRTGIHTVYAPLGSRSSVIFDLDGDGDLDIVTNEMNAEPQVLVSDLAQRHMIRWLAVSLEGTKSNRDGLGAVVQVHAAGKILTQIHDGQSGYLSQSRAALYFGLGDAECVDRVEVRWPSGAVQRLVPLPAVNTTVIVRELTE